MKRTLKDKVSDLLRGNNRPLKIIQNIGGVNIVKYCEGDKTISDKEVKELKKLFPDVLTILFTNEQVGTGSNVIDFTND